MRFLTLKVLNIRKKKDYGDALRDVLDTEIEFERLTKDDIIELTNIISNMLSGGKNDNETEEQKKQKKPLKTLVDASGEFLTEWNGPIITKLREKARNELIDSEDKE